jgi:hypothetical protein
VVAAFENPSLQVKIDDILICSGIPEKDTREVIPIELATSIAAFLNTNSRSKNFQRGLIWFTPIVTFEWGDASILVHNTVVEIY